MNQKQIKSVLSDWPTLLGFLRTCSEEDAKTLLEEEGSGAARRTMMIRIHQRFNVMRGRRERAEIASAGMRTR
jgi:hypothetical protein